jgi:hypothetical protein
MECQDSNYRHMAVSIKTLGPEVDAVVLAIGVTTFDPEDGVIGTKRCYIPSDTKRGTVNMNTLWYWANMASEALANYTGLRADLGTAMPWADISKTLATWISRQKVDILWATDHAMLTLDYAFERAGVSNPLRMLERRDAAQWALAANRFGWEEPARPKEYPAYYALPDAEWQSLLVCNLWRFSPCPNLKSADTTAQPTTT